MRMKGFNLKKTYVFKKIDETFTDFYMFAGENPDKITSSAVNEFKSQTFKNFNGFAVNAFRVHKIRMNQKIWKKSLCTCPDCGKNYLCKHIVYLAYELLLLPPPTDLLEATTSVAPKKNPRGRPRKATPALIKD